MVLSVPFLLDTQAVYSAVGVSEDRLIATALVEGVQLVSSDREFKRYKGLKTIW